MIIEKHSKIIKKQYLKGLRLFLAGTILLSLSTALLGQIRVIEARKAAPKSKRLSTVLLEKGSGLPISDAFIFIRNSSISTTSDLSGYFELDQGAFSKTELVLTHLNYETQSFYLTEKSILPDTIYLVAKELELAAVEIKSKKGKSKKRKKWMKRFKAAFFGSNKWAKSITFLNPEVVWFQEDGRNLRAEAIDYLSIINHDLGYKMRFYLDTFYLDKRKHVVYSGKVFFEDLITQGTNQEQLRKNRQLTYVASKKYFFKSLWDKNVSSEEFTFGIAQMDAKGRLLAFEEKDIPIEKIGNHAIITTNNYFAFANKNIVTKFGANYFTGGSDTHATGLLKPLAGKIIFDQNGHIVNGQEIEESGYWTQRRIARLLPLEYNYVVTPESFFDWPNQRRRQLEQLQTARPQEKVYLHLNKPYYSLRDDLYFKAYLTNAHDHQTSPLSKVVYIDLIDPEGAIVKSWMLHTEKRLTGHFTMNQQQLAGQYTIRAYTEYMRNFGDAYFFQQTIPVYATSKKSVDSVAQQVIAKTEMIFPPKTKKLITTQFYPEGGYLVEGLASNVSFEVLDTAGNPLIAEGVIMDDLGEVQSKIKTTHRGIGLFNFIPRTSKTYYAKIAYQGKQYEFELPKALQAGYVLKINNTDAEKLYLDFFADKLEKLSDAFVIGHVRGNIFCMVNDLTNGTLTIPKASIPTGLAHFTLFDGNNQLVAERLLFNDYGIDTSFLGVEISPDKFQKRTKVALKISCPDSLQTALNVSASVTDKSVVNYPNYSENIQTWLWLNSDLVQTIDYPNFYLRQINQRKRFLLDLLVMTKKWRRFDWQTSVDTALTFPVEVGYSIEGYTTTLDGTKRQPTNVTLSALNQQFYHETQATDSAGNFKFANLPFLDSLDFILQGRILGFTESEAITGKNRTVSFKMQSKDKPASVLPTIKNNTKSLPPIIADYLAMEQRASLIDSVFEQDWTIDLAEITVKADYILNPALFGVYDLNRFDWIPPKTTGLRLIRMFNPRNAYEMDYATGQLFKWEYVLGEYIKIPVTVIVNGQVGSASRILSIEADLIDYFSFNNSNPNAGGGAVISIVTRKDGPRSLQAHLKNGILNITHPGYHQARTFYAPNYSQTLPIHEKPDLRTAIHWQPNLTFDATGNALLEFYTADSPATYEVRIEGITEDGRPIFMRKDFFVE